MPSATSVRFSSLFLLGVLSVTLVFSALAALGAASCSPSNYTINVGGDRPIEVYVPDSYDPAVPNPLLFILHGYSDDPQLRLNFFKPAAEAEGFIYLAPSGTAEAGTGRLFWNVPNMFSGNSTVDDEGYLLGLIDEISCKLNIDKRRVYFIGLSNGNFMAYYLACKHADRIAAILGVVGAMDADISRCRPSSPISVMHVHGTADELVSYEGNTTRGGLKYTGAEQTVNYWAQLNNCTGANSPVIGTPIELEPGKGKATTPITYSGCPKGVDVMLYKVQGGTHLLNVPQEFTYEAMEFLADHRKPRKCGCQK